MGVDNENPRPLARGLVIHLGARDSRQAMLARRASPASYWLLYIHPGDALEPPCQGVSCQSVDAEQAALDAASKTIREMELDEGASVWTRASDGLEKRYASLFEALRARAAAALSEVRCAKAGRLLFARAALLNMASLAKNGAWRLDGKAFKNRKAILCGAGPSLTRALPILKSLEGQAAVIAAGRACKALLGAGIQPDLVCEMDAMSHVNWPAGLSLKAPLLAPLTVSPGLAANFGKILWTEPPELPKQLLEILGVKLPEVKMDRSVGVYALDAAASLFAFDEVALLGFDLCFGPDGASHAGAAPSDFDGDEADLRKIPGRDGGFVASNSLFDGMRESFEAHPSMRSGRVFNCSEGGAAIKGAKPRSLENFLKGETAFPLKGRMEEAVESLDAPSPEALRAFASSEKTLKLLRGLAAKQAAGMALESPGSLDASKMAEGLFDDLSESLASLAAARTPEPNSEAHCVFLRSLRDSALERVAKSHGAFAELLSKTPPLDAFGRTWRIRPNFARLPFVALERAGRRPLRLSANSCMDVVAGAEVEAFLRASAFNAKTDAALFIAPGNWIHPVEFALREPRAKMLVVELWPELFARLIERCQFLHKLPDSAQIVGACEELPDWQAVLRRRAGRLRADGFQLKTFVPPYAFQIPEFKTTLGFVESTNV